MTRPITSYVLFGGHETWTVAATLAAQLPAGIGITVIESSRSERASLVLPLDDPYFAAVGMTAGDLAEAGADFALGHALDGFLGEGTRVIAAPSGDLPAIAGLALHQVLRAVADKAGALDRLAELHEGFRFCARAAAEGRMALAEDAPESPLAMLGPLVVVDQARLAALLRERIAEERVRHLEGQVSAIERGERGEMRALRLDGGQAVEADVFIDLRAPSGPVAQSGNIPLPLLEALASSDASIMAQPSASAMPTYTACSGAAGGEVAPHALAEPWSGNLIRLGPASASLGPLFSADARLLLAQIRELTACLPARTDALAEARRFNRLHARAIDRLYELVATPLHLNRRAEPAWKGLREIAPPTGLALRIEQFRSRGHLPECDGELVDRQFWIDLLMAFGVVPQRHVRRAEAFAPRQLDSALGTIRGQLDAALAAMPTRDRFLLRFGDR